MTQPWFIAVERFGPANGAAWAKYVEWSKLDQVEELVSLDNMLCPTVLKDIRDHHWPHIVNEDCYLHFFTDLEFLRQELAAEKVEGARLLCVLRNPDKRPSLSAELSSFCFLGFDLVEAASGISALSNCGGWPELGNRELSKWGLLTDHTRALDLQAICHATIPKSHMRTAMYGRSSPNLECPLSAKADEIGGLAFPLSNRLGVQSQTPPGKAPLSIRPT
jgi:hypothetical protein